MGEHMKIIEYPKENRSGIPCIMGKILIPGLLCRGNRFINKRFYTSMAATVLPKGNSELTKSCLNPWFITGFTDGDDSFSLLVSKDTKGKLLCKVQPVFTIGLHPKDLPLLEKIQKSFGGVGKIHIRKDGSGVHYIISSVKDLINQVIPHFDNYPLISKKKADYELFKEIVLLMKNKEHLTNKGLLKIMSLKAFLNLGLKGWVAEIFTDIKLVVRPEVKLVNNLNPYWVSGFICAEGCFYITLRINDKYKAGYEAGLKFILSPNNRDFELIYKIKDLFNSGYVARSKKDDTVELTIKNFNALKQNLVPFLNRYNLEGAKSLDFNDFKTVLFLMNDKVHLTKEGYNKLKVIKNGMNTGRK